MKQKTVSSRELRRVIFERTILTILYRACDRLVQEALGLCVLSAAEVDFVTESREQNNFQRARSRCTTEKIFVRDLSR